MENNTKLSSRDMNTLRQRKFYEKHKEEVNKKVLDAYHTKRQKQAENGVTLRGRGRPRREIKTPIAPQAPAETSA